MATVVGSPGLNGSGKSVAFLTHITVGLTMMNQLHIHVMDVLIIEQYSSSQNVASGP